MKKKNLRKLSALVLIGLLAANLVGCADKKASENTTAISTTEEATKENSSVATSEDVEVATVDGADDVVTEETAGYASDDFDEWEAAHTEWEAMMADLETKYEAAKEAPDARNSDGAVEYEVNGIKCYYAGKNDVQSIKRDDTDHSLLVLVKPGTSERVMSVGIYNKDFNESGWQAVIDKNHANTDSNGVTYYTASNKNDSSITYIAYPTESGKEVFGVIQVHDASYSADDLSFCISN